MRPNVTDNKNKIYGIYHTLKCAHIDRSKVREMLKQKLTYVSIMFSILCIHKLVERLVQFDSGVVVLFYSMLSTNNQVFSVVLGFQV